MNLQISLGLFTRPRKEFDFLWVLEKTWHLHSFCQRRLSHRRLSGMDQHRDRPAPRRPRHHWGLYVRFEETRDIQCVRPVQHQKCWMVEGCYTLLEHSGQARQKDCLLQLAWLPTTRGGLGEPARLPTIHSSFGPFCPFKEQNCSGVWRSFH